MTPGTDFTDPSAEKASRAVLGAAGQVLSLLQSAIVFCKSQVKLAGLKVDHPWVREYFHGPRARAGRVGTLGSRRPPAD